MRGTSEAAVRRPQLFTLHSKTRPSGVRGYADKARYFIATAGLMKVLSTKVA
jgi:hypothetical protein